MIKKKWHFGLNPLKEELIVFSERERIAVVNNATNGEAIAKLPDIAKTLNDLIDCIEGGYESRNTLEVIKEAKSHLKECGYEK